MGLTPRERGGWLRRRGGALEPFWGRMPALWEGPWAPDIDVSETGTELVVRAEVPGVEAGDLDVEVAGRMLTLKGEKRHEREEKDESHHLVERSWGSFERSVELPCEVDASKAEATFKNGVLKVRLPKTEEARAKKVEVQ